MLHPLFAGVLAILSTNVNVPFFMNTYQPEGNVNVCRAGDWCPVDVSAFVQAGARGVCLTTMLIITNGKTSGLSNLTMGVRRHGDAGGRYHAQVIAIGPTGGARTSDFICVELSPEKKYDVFWNRAPTDSPQWPEGPAFGLNQTINLVLGESR